jgi:serine/threonine protein kinase/tetratricopeptide (TPR) repeat protein
MVRMDQHTSIMIDEGARRRFEAAWRGDAFPVLDEFLPASGDPAWLATLTELILIDIEMRWKRRDERPGGADRIEDYLRRFPKIESPRILRQLIQHEFNVRKRCGDSPREADYAARFVKYFDTSMTIQSTGSDLSSQMGFADAIAVPNIPGYEIESMLGRGGMGVVFLARQIRLKRPVAIKMILAGAYADAEDLARFRGEAEAIARLQHPNIIQIYEIGETGDRPYFSMEYAGGGSLTQQLDGAPLATAHAAELVRTLAQAVQYAHQNGIVHRDLKPSNVLFSAPPVEAAAVASRSVESHDTFRDEMEIVGNAEVLCEETATRGGPRIPKITDFGLAKQLDDDSQRTKTGAVLGTPSYMAPEQASGNWRQVGTAADVYALGAILYECLTGRPPFKAASAIETLEQVRNQEPVAPRVLQPRCPCDLETICLKCLEKQIERRYSTAAELAEELSRFLRHEPILARPIGPAGRAWRWCRRQPYQAALGLTIMGGLLAVVAGLFLWQGANHRKQQQILSLRSEQSQEAIRQLSLRQQSVEMNQQRGLEEAAAGRFESAELFLRQAVHHAGDGSGFERLRAVVTEQHDRVERLKHFYQLSQKAELLAFIERDDRAKQMCEDALQKIGILGDDLQWWKKLPMKELLPDQIERLQLDANHQLLLLAALHMKHALFNVRGEDAKEAYRAAAPVLQKVHAFHEAKKLPQCVSAQILENYCYYQLGQLNRIKRIESKQPGTASDCYFQGIAFYWLVMSPKGPITDSVKLAFRLFGFDTSDPANTAQAMLRMSLSQDPSHHWSYLWLGWSMQSVQDFRGSEMAFASLITLKPESVIGYAERARSVAFQARDLANQKLDPKVEKIKRDELWHRCRLDLDRASARDSADWYIQLRRIESLALFQEHEKSLDACRAMMEAMPPPNRLVGLPANETEGFVREVHDYVQRLYGAAANHVESQCIIALVHLRNGRWADAEAAAAKVLGGSVSNERAVISRSVAHLVRGQILLSRGKASDALAAFDESLRHRPTYFHAALGRATALALAGDRDGALEACDLAAKLAGSDWQMLELRLERIAAYLTLGRRDDALAEMEKARLLNSSIADEYRRRWFED